jgi:hypothetical protein
MQAFETNSATWNYIISEYQSIVDQYHWPFKPMLELAQKLSASAPDQLFPGMSHEHLGFSIVRDYPQMIHLPQVWISYLPQSNLFEITFREFLGGPQTKTSCQPDKASEVVEAVLTELLARRHEPAAPKQKQ